MGVFRRRGHYSYQMIQRNADLVSDESDRLFFCPFSSFRGAGLVIAWNREVGVRISFCSSLGLDLAR